MSLFNALNPGYSSQGFLFQIFFVYYIKEVTMDILNFISWIRGGRVVNTVDPAKTLLPVGLKDKRRDDAYLAGAISVEDFIAQIGGGLGGTQYVFVVADGTDIENAAELQAAYVTAQGMSPSVANRITVIAAPGNYNFGGIPFVMDTQYIDLVSLDGNRSIVLNSANNAGTISITADDVFVKGVDVVSKNFTIATNLMLLKVENCKGGNFSFGGQGGIAVSGTFTNCVGDAISFGGDFGIANGKFTNCVGGTFSFAGNAGTASGVFTDCVGDNYSFGSDPSGLGGGDASGTFINCTGGRVSFGGATAASGVFTNCTGGASQFGNGSFGGGFLGIASGTFSNCVAGSSAFGGGGGIASGTFTNCTGGSVSFGRFGILEGKLYYCRLTGDTFETVTSPGITRLCIDGNNVENNQG